MKIVKSNGHGRNAFLAVITLLILFSIGSCSKKISFLNSSVVPAAHGSVKVDKDRNNNYNIEINVTHLAPPKKLQPARETYVVWMETDKHGTKNIGKLNSSSGFLSKTLKASLNTVSTFKPSKIFVTAEDDARILNPGKQIVLTTKSF